MCTALVLSCSLSHRRTPSNHENLSFSNDFMASRAPETAVAFPHGAKQRCLGSDALKLSAISYADIVA